MKKGLLFTAFMFFLTFVSANEYKVTTEVQKKNVLLEEFTGIHCGFCPKGHAIAARLKIVLGDKINVIAVHSGAFALPSPDQPDFRIPEGEYLDSVLGAHNSGYPCGSINRKNWYSDYPDLFVTTRSVWQDFTVQSLTEDAPVNLYSTAVYQSETRKLNIHVEGYFTSDVADVNRLHIFLLENNIVGPQNGGGVGSDYVHQHMLRDIITAKEGDLITNSKKGSYFSKDIEYTVPENINGVTLNAAETDLVIFLSDDTQKNVMNSIKVKPEYKGEILPLKASISQNRIKIGGGYRYNFVNLTFENKSNVEFSSAEFEVKLNGNVKTSQWTGSLAPFATTDIKLPVDFSAAAADNKYEIKLLKINGEVATSNSLTGRFLEPKEAPAELKIKIKTDNYASQNTFVIFDMDGKIIKEFGPYADGTSDTYIEKVSLVPNETYCFQVTDYWGDGMYSPRGTVKIYDLNDNLIGQQLEISGFGWQYFFKAHVADAVEEVEVSQLPVDVYTVSGLKIQSAENEASINTSLLTPGIYILKTSESIKKIYVNR